jgi:SAM-dependent methyltransferase
METPTIERLDPERLPPGEVTGQSTLVLHLQRYEFAAQYIKPGRLLDIACGIGYGTALMAERASGVTEFVGVDISEKAVEQARLSYTSEKICFLQHDAMTYKDEDGFDTIVSVETLEHTSDPARIIANLVDNLRPGGVFIASVPVTPSTDVNPYHLHDFTERSFRKMVGRFGLKELDCLRQVQPYPLIPTLRRKESRMKDMRKGLVVFYSGHPWAFVKRIWATLRFGFTNRYLTVVWQNE